MKLFKIYTKEKGLIEPEFVDDIIRRLTWHRLDGPAVIGYNANGKLKYESYWINNKRNRLNGPASIYYDINGNITEEAYYINGIEYTKDQYYNELLKLKVQSL